MSALEDRVQVIEIRPLVSTRQVIVTCVALLGTVFAAGAWAQSLQGKQNTLQASQATMQATLSSMATDLKQLSQVDRMQDRIDRLEKEIDVLREERRGK